MPEHSSFQPDSTGPQQGQRHGNFYGDKIMRAKILGGFLIAVSCLAHGTTDSSIKIKTVGSSFSSGTTPAEVPAKFTLPEGEQIPAIVIVHGSAGPDSRGRFHTEYLVANGFAVLELDMWSARGVTTFSQRPKTTLDTLPDVWGAWLFLAGHPKINKDKIAIMGFSWGGVNAMTTAFGKKPKDPPPSLASAKFAAHIAFYPVCDIWVKNGIASRVVDPSSPTGAPIQIHNGTRDDYDTSASVCESLKATHPQMPLEVIMYDGAAHGFDSANAQPIQFFDPVAKNGKGGQVILVSQERARIQSKENVLAFLKKNLAAK